MIGSRDPVTSWAPPCGMLIDTESSANFVPFDGADDWLQLLLGAGMIPLRAFRGRRRALTPHHDIDGSAGSHGAGRPFGEVGQAAQRL